MLVKARKAGQSVWDIISRPWFVALAVVTAIMVNASLASAITVTTNVTSDFAAVKSTLESYIVAGALMVVTLALIVIGILMIIRWARRAARS